MSTRGWTLVERMAEAREKPIRKRFSPTRRQGRRTALQKLRFTLVELMVVVSVIAVIAALLLPALASARNTAARAVDVANMRQMQTALLLYMEQYDRRQPVQASYTNSIGSEVLYPVALAANLGLDDYMSRPAKQPSPRPVVGSRLHAFTRDTDYRKNGFSVYHCPLERPWSSLQTVDDYAAEMPRWPHLTTYLAIDKYWDINCNEATGSYRWMQRRCNGTSTYNTPGATCHGHGQHNYTWADPLKSFYRWQSTKTLANQPDPSAAAVFSHKTGDVASYTYLSGTYLFNDAVVNGNKGLGYGQEIYHPGGLPIVFMDAHVEVLSTAEAMQYGPGNGSGTVLFGHINYTGN